MSECEICSAPLTETNKKYITIPDTNVSHSICRGCATYLSALRGGTGHIETLETCVNRMSPFLDSEEMEEDLAEYLKSLLSNATAEIERQRNLNDAEERRKQAQTEAEAERAEREAREKEQEEQEKILWKETWENFKMTTGHQFDGYKTMEYINIVSGEIVLGGGVVKELLAFAGDSFGTRYESYESSLGHSKKAALKKPKRRRFPSEQMPCLGLTLKLLRWAPA